MTTTSEKNALALRGAEILNQYRDVIEDGLLLITIHKTANANMTALLAVTLAYSDGGRVKTANLTWAISRALGYRLTDGMAGNHRLAIGGYGYSKPLDVAISLARFYGLDTYALKFEII